MRFGFASWRSRSTLLEVALGVAVLASAGCGGGGGSYGSEGGGGSPESATYRCGAYPCDPAILTIENGTSKTITETGWRTSGAGTWNVHDWTDGGTSQGIRPNLSTFLTWAVLEAGTYDVYAKGTNGLFVQVNAAILVHPKTHFYVTAAETGEIR